MTDVTMPRLSDSMEEGTIVTWHVQDGAEVKAGEELAEIETDKATVSFEAEADGVITLLVAAGQTVPLGAPIARIGAMGGGAAPLPTAAAASADAVVAPREDVRSAGSVSESNGSGAASRPVASPLARRLAASLGVDLRELTGTGPRGRIVRGDVERATSDGIADTALQSSAPRAERQGAAAAGVPVSPPEVGASSAKGEVTLVELSRMQQLIARRMAESRATVPDFEVAVDVDMEAAFDLREQLKADAGENAVVPSFNDLIVLACGRTLREQPQVNSSYRGGAIERFERVNVGVAIAAPDSLVVATVFDADRLSLGAIARTTRRLAAEVREGSIAPPALAGATFTVSNLGMFGISRFSAVINSPQAAILAVGAVQQRAVVREGAVVARRCMTMSLAADHRVLYGADGARFLARVRELLEAPLLMLLG